MFIYSVFAKKQVLWKTCHKFSQSKKHHGIFEFLFPLFTNSPKKAKSLARKSEDTGGLEKKR